LVRTPPENMYRDLVAGRGCGGRRGFQIGDLGDHGRVLLLSFNAQVEGGGKDDEIDAQLENGADQKEHGNYLHLGSESRFPGLHFKFHLLLRSGVEVNGAGTTSTINVLATDFLFDLRLRPHTLLKPRLDGRIFLM